MINENNNCNEFRYSINSKGKLEGKCNKEYCRCQDKFVWDINKDIRYQKAKIEGKAHSGIFLNK